MCALSQSAWCSVLPGNEGNSEWNTEVVNILIIQLCPAAAKGSPITLHPDVAESLSPSGFEYIYLMIFNNNQEKILKSFEFNAD